MNFNTNENSDLLISKYHVNEGKAQHLRNRAAIQPVFQRPVAPVATYSTVSKYN